MSRVVIVIQARIGSERLPGKVLKELVPGKTLISALLDRLRLCKKANHLLVATSDTVRDDVLSKHVERIGIDVFRGDEHDVLSRFVGAAQRSKADVIVRICADSPLIDAEVIDAAIDQYLSHLKDIDFLTNMLPETFPYGMAVEVLSADVLTRLAQLACLDSDREHVTSYVYRTQQDFRILNLAAESDFSHLRFAVDYPEDFDFVQRVYSVLYKENAQFNWKAVVNLVNSQPDILSINAKHNERLNKQIIGATNQQ
jgi:spore coat polysaccharide biosynthesis protein SpsF